jgi:glycerate kinase
MVILIAPDSFKEALDAMAVCEAIRTGLRAELREAECHCFPMADGGEGTAALLAAALHGEPIREEVRDPLHRPTEAVWFRTPDGTAILEVASASGIQLVRPSERNPMEASSYGTGQLLAAAVGSGCRRILLGLGGSATNDAGMGMAAALGWTFRSVTGQTLPPCGKNLGRVHTMRPPSDGPGRRLSAGEIEVIACCDVRNPMYGPDGAARVFAAQKGADADMVEMLDRGLAHFAAVMSQSCGHDFSAVPGSGAAGGLGAGAMAFLGARLSAGAEMLMAANGLGAAMASADLVITGEGSLDHQTAGGKVASAVLRAATYHHIPVVGLFGSVRLPPAAVREMGWLAALSVSPGPQDLQTALGATAVQLERTAAQVARLLGWAPSQSA